MKALLLLSLLALPLLGGEVTFGWFPNPEADGVTGYEVHWGAEAGTYTGTADVGMPAEIRESPEGTRIISGPVEIPAGDWFVALTAYRTEGETRAVSDYSEEINITVHQGPPAPPTGFIEITVEATTDLRNWDPIRTFYREEKPVSELFRLAYRPVAHDMTYLVP